MWAALSWKLHLFALQVPAGHLPLSPGTSAEQAAEACDRLVRCG